MTITRGAVAGHLARALDRLEVTTLSAAAAAIGQSTAAMLHFCAEIGPYTSRKFTTAAPVVDDDALMSVASWATDAARGVSGLALLALRSRDGFTAADVAAAMTPKVSRQRISQVEGSESVNEEMVERYRAALKRARLARAQEAAAIVRAELEEDGEA